MNRRSFIKHSVLTSAATASVLTPSALQAAEPSPAATPAAPARTTVARGRIGKLEVSRLLLGGNLLTHYTHSRDLQYVYNLARHYNTEDKILETMSLAEAHGINTLVIHTAPNVLGFLKRARKERGSRMQWIICPTAPIEPGLAEYRKQVKELVQDGVDAIYLWGVRSDALVQENKLDLLAEAVAVARAEGVPSGVGAHLLDVIVACENHKVDADFYIKTFHHHQYPSAKLNFDSMWCTNPEETADVMFTVQKPWIAFKVMAAGAIPPKNAFEYAFSKGADFVLAGMFDFEIADDVRIANEVLAAKPERTRPWRG